MNTYFSSISNIDDSNATLPTFERKSEAKLENIEMFETEILDVINNLNVNKASGPDGISHKMLKATSSTIA